MEKSKKISFDAGNRSQKLEAFDKVESVIEEEPEKIRVVVKEEPERQLTAFERYWGTSPDKIVLTKEEEKRWKKE
jgi:hypothetical protein